jgi:hypothetical protein
MEERKTEPPKVSQMCPFSAANEVRDLQEVFSLRWCVDHKEGSLWLGLLWRKNKKRSGKRGSDNTKILYAEQRKG